jgi:hypothetical protein
LNYGYDPTTARLQEFLQLLNSNQVDYLLVGGYAVAYHGYPRATGDMDIWIAVHPRNAEKVVETLTAFGLAHQNCHPKTFLQHEQIIRMGYHLFALRFLRQFRALISMSVTTSELLM